MTENSFSWKEARQNHIKRAKQRIEIYKRNGRAHFAKKEIEKTQRMIEEDKE